MRFLIVFCVVLLVLNNVKEIRGQTSEVTKLNQSPNTTTASIPLTECDGLNQSTSFTTTIPLTESRDPCPGLNCTEDELCKEKHGVYGCFCRQNHHSFDFNETCESSSGFMSVSRCQLFEAGFPSDVLHLNDPSCRGTVRNGRVEFYFDNNDHICGTSLTANGTHIIYENFILGESNTNHLIARKKKLKIRFSCVYSQTQNLSLNLSPLASSTLNMTPPAGQGTYQVRMTPYQDSAFSQTFAGTVSAELKKRIFVEVRVDGVDSSQFASVIDSCWATPVNNPLDLLHWDLITNMCPSPNDNVQLFQNGVSTSSRFSFSMFVFTANSTQIFLHCTVHLCLLSNSQCSVQCDVAHRRRDVPSVILRDSMLISVGPLMLSKGNQGTEVLNQVQMSAAAHLDAFLMIPLISMMSVLMCSF